MAIYYIQNDETGLYLIGRTTMNAPVPTYVWGNRLRDAMAFCSAFEASRIAAEIGERAASIYRVQPGNKCGDNA